MESRDQLSRENYQQAVKFAQQFADDVKQEYEREAEQRYQFEKAQFEQSELQNNAKKRPLARMTTLSLLAILLLGVAYYSFSGRYQVVQEGLNVHKDFQQQMSEAHGTSKNERYIISLQNQLRENPNNGDLWYELGQAYVLSNDFDSALVCYDNAQKLLGKKAAILGAIATARYYDNGQKMNKEISAMIDEALSLDKNESASLLLRASDGFLNNNYQQALDYWRKVLDGNDNAINRRAIIQSMEMTRQILEGQQGK
ncbi:cytochrome C biogenesis protein [Mannheimia pernigra]|uniref:Cytochrome C biogenesis protein n=1 Tax=Mannheimia pernigra TaxID=111844 RepID=A0ABD7A832_9PAST|nr:cytochrome C biogenesis protein [Mannheimia pernigra]QLB42185.1 cytochrome C biogenesis protein [Mannheimia pernigra]